MPEESHLERERRAKIARWRAEGREPFPWSFPDRMLIRDVRALTAPLAPGAEATDRTARVAGRLTTVRTHGGTSFIDLEDLSGRLQLLLTVHELGEETYRRWLADLDPGDIIGAVGVPAVSRRGEPSLRVESLELLAKAISPPPEKFHGLQDPEERIRRRYLDLMSSAESRDRFRVRSLLTREIRGYFDAAGFLEVETPILLHVAGGAAATPFVTHSRYLDAELQLRIAIELSLKPLLVGGLERVYEIGRCFRNEDLDTTHSPEFTMLELYWAYADYYDMRRMMEGLYERLGARILEWQPDSEAAQRAAKLFHAPFPTLDFVQALEERSGIHDILAKSPEELGELARRCGATVPTDSPPGVFLDKLFEHYVEPTIDRPTFVVDHPASTTPLAKRHRSLAGRVERFEIHYRGFELGNCYTELNDPDEQEQRFQAQLAGRGGDRYAYDAEFVEALRYGMPPATGIGFGIDRIAMALTGAASIKDVLLFPQVRPR
ncbi:MAG: lysine--tRNA ligase [Thermoplasmata archaeon]|jgi:lysyl-tRNA synthetase class 2